MKYPGDADIPMNTFEKLFVKNISFSYENSPVIENINIKVFSGEIVSILGPSGSGKTTLFNVISGLNKPDCGEVLLNKENITDRPGKVSYMLQKDLLLPYLSIEDNVSLPLRIKGYSKAEARKAVAKDFSTFGLEDTQKKFPAQLSGGMRQRAALFRTYMFSKDMCLLDEPFSALDTLTKEDMHSWYLSVMEQIKLTTLLITHDIDEAIKLSDRIYILSGKPGTIKGELIIDKPRPRNKDFPLSEEFLNYKKQILELL